MWYLEQVILLVREANQPPQLRGGRVLGIALRVCFRCAGALFQNLVLNALGILSSKKVLMCNPEVVECPNWLLRWQLAVSWLNVKLMKSKKYSCPYGPDMIKNDPFLCLISSPAPAAIMTQSSILSLITFGNSS